MLVELKFSWFWLVWLLLAVALRLISFPLVFGAAQLGFFHFGKILRWNISIWLGDLSWLLVLRKGAIQKSLGARFLGLNFSRLGLRILKLNFLLKLIVSQASLSNRIGSLKREIETALLIIFSRSDSRARLWEKKCPWTYAGGFEGVFCLLDIPDLMAQEQRLIWLGSRIFAIGLSRSLGSTFVQIFLDVDFWTVYLTTVNLRVLGGYVDLVQQFWWVADFGTYWLVQILVFCLYRSSCLQSCCWDSQGSVLRSLW